MAFKFTLLGLENDSCNCDNSDKKTKKTKHKERFAEAVQTCHKETKTKEAFGGCMRKELKK